MLAMAARLRCCPVIWVEVELQLTKRDLKRPAIFQFWMAASTLSGVVAEMKIDLL